MSNNLATTTPLTLTPIQRLHDAIRFSCGGYASATARDEAIARGISKAAAYLAQGQWIVEDATGVGLFDPAYAMKGFRPLRWMTQEGIRTMRTLTQLTVGDSFTREISFHPRHGITTRTARRLA